MTAIRPPRRRGPLLSCLLVLPLAACGGLGDGGDGSPSQDGADITVLAAASLTESFTTLAERFEETHPGTRVRLAFDSSATLAEQAAGGAPADVLATADEDTMADAESAGALAGSPTPFATNTMMLATPADNPADIRELADLAGTTYVLCVPTAPCGKVADAVLSDAGVSAEPASLEPDVKAVLAKVTADEADAGLIYATDAVAAGEAITTIELPQAADHPTTYPIAVLEQSKDKELAREFTELVLNEAGQAVLEQVGFGLVPR